MDSRSDTLAKLASIAGAFDDEVYCTYASKGLLRRARKSLSAGTSVDFMGVEDGVAVFQSDAQTIRIGPAGPLKAQCSCPAPGGCVHVIMVCLQLQRIAAEDSRETETASVPETPPDEKTTKPEEPAKGDSPKKSAPWLEYSVESLRKWSGAEAYRKAWGIIDRHGPKVGATEVVFANNIKCHLIPDAGLDGIITNAPPRDHKSYAVAAVLAIQIEHGLALEAERRDGIRQAPDLSLLPDIREILEEMTELGLNHLSETFIRRIHRLSVLCRTGRLYRPAKELESCGQEIEWLFKRHARGSISGLFNKMAGLYALAVSIGNMGEKAPAELTGTARSTYAEMDTLRLVGMGLYPWETESGFIGLTALFWSPEWKTYFSWSDSRPKNSGDGFTPRKRYEEEAPWFGGSGLKALTRSAFLMENPKANPERRLSAHEGSKVTCLESPIDPGQLPNAYTSWSDLMEEISARKRIGLRRGGPLDALCLIQPKAFHKPVFDEISQALVIPMEDEKKDTLLLQLPFTQWTQSAIFYLEENYKKLSGSLLLGYFSSPGGTGFFPISKIEPDSEIQILDLLFTPMPKKKIKWRGLILERIKPFIPLPENGRDDIDRAISEADEFALFLSPLDDYLLRVAESGFRTNEKEALSSLNLAGAGLLQLDKDLKNIHSPGDLLMTRYHYLLHMEAAGA